MTLLNLLGKITMLLHYSLLFCKILTEVSFKLEMLYPAKFAFILYEEYKINTLQWFNLNAVICYADS